MGYCTHINSVFLIIGLTCCDWVRATYDASQASNIQTAILSGYQTSQRPSNTLPIDMGFGINHISKLDTKHQKLGLVGFLLLARYDSRLAWNASDYGGVDEIYLTSSDIWVPVVVLSNAADAFTVLGDSSDLASVPIKITNSGVVAWLAPANFEAYCELNIKYYPFDKQTCSMEVHSWMYLSSIINFELSQTEVNTDMYTENGEWHFLRYNQATTNSSVESKSKTLLSNQMPGVKYSMTFSRKYSYYLLNMILPVLFLNGLGLFVFILPAESGEKVGFSLTILLSLSVVVTMVSDSIPPTSTTTCLLSVFLLVGYLISVLIVLMVVINLKLHHLGEKDTEVPDWLQRFTQTVLARISCWRGNKVDMSKDKVTDKTGKGVYVDKDRNQKNDNGRQSSLAWEQADAEYSYQDIAMMLDKICFISFSVMTVVVTVVFLLVLILSSS